MFIFTAAGTSSTIIRSVRIEMRRAVSSDISRAWVAASNTRLAAFQGTVSRCVWTRTGKVAEETQQAREQRARPDQYELHLFNSIVARQKRNDIAKLRLFPRFAFTGKTGKYNDTKPWDPSWYGRVNSRVKWESGWWYISIPTIDYSMKFFGSTTNVGSMFFYTIFRGIVNVWIHDWSTRIDSMGKCTNLVDFQTTVLSS